MKKNNSISLIVFTIGILFFTNCFSQNIEDANIRSFYVGTYTDTGSEGIYRFGLDMTTGKLHSDGLSAMSENPSFLTITNDRKYLLAVHETSDENGNRMGYIESFSIHDSGSLTSINKVLSGGSHPCYVSVNKDGLVLAANYTGGNVSLFKLSRSGELSEATDVKQHYGKGPNSSRQDKPHAHSAYFEPNGKRIFVADLGIDMVKVYNADTSTLKLNPCKIPEIKMASGSGPRHLAFHPNGKILYVINELASSVTSVKLLPVGNFNVFNTLSTLPDGYKEQNTCADIHISPDGRFLYASNRGLNSVAIFAVDEKSGLLKLIGQEPTKGETPRNFTISPDGKYLLVANQNSNNIVAFKRDEKTGKLTYTDQISAKKPVCLLFDQE
jgi:6-phosphogluconolactonase